MTADFKDTIEPTVCRFNWGGAQVTTVLEGRIVRDAVNPPFALEKTEEELAEIGKANNIPGDRFEHVFVPTVINTGGKLVLFDAGFGPKAGAANGAGHLRSGLAAAGYAPEDIDIVALTHVHPDHILGLLQDGQPAFPKAQMMIGRREFDEWNSGANIPDQRRQNREMFLTHVAPFAERMTFLEDGDAVAPGITAEAAFGHSLGHMMYRFEGEGRQLLVWGDVTNHYVYSLQYPDSMVGFDDDKDAARVTRNRVLDMVASDGLLVAGHHMPFPSIGYVEKTSSYRWVPASYQHRL
ncbi:MAG: MBL fold metallo-hydrolase [Rhodobacteraceae bacterium]|nr:MBL fold metallo-hydrolase [Paracoccaceae bacterium]